MRHPVLLIVVKLLREEKKDKHIHINSYYLKLARSPLTIHKHVYYYISLYIIYNIHIILFVDVPTTSPHCGWIPTSQGHIWGCWHQDGFSTQLLFRVKPGGRNPAPVDRWFTNGLPHLYPIIDISYYKLIYGFNHPRWCRISSIHSMSNDILLEVPNGKRCPICDGSS